MEKQVLEEVLDVMTGERTVFRYVRDGYALSLLEQLVGDGMSIAQIRQTAFAHLLQKPVVKQWMAASGEGRITAEQLALARWQTEQKPLNFVLTLDRWGGDSANRRHWLQMSRRGYHLVLQLNFANDHEKQYRRLIKTDDIAALSYRAHPVLKDGRYETLAWARIDLDFESNTALIEEIQSDWVREATCDWNRRYYQEADFDTYWNEVLAPYAKVWDEAILTAAIELIRRELGIEHVYYHTFETGNKLKGIEHCPPPQSLYSKLPKRFGFQITQDMPSFLQQERHVKKMLGQHRKGAGQKEKRAMAKQKKEILNWYILPATGDDHEQAKTA